MKNKPAFHPIIITSPSQWEPLAQRLSQAAAIGLDLEGNGFFRYPEHICLIQLCVEDRVFLLDPLAVKELSALGRILSQPAIIKIFHSCDWDLRSLDRDYGFRAKNIFDTSIAARFLGLNKAGLGNVLKHFLDVEVDKSKSLQRQNWTLRPLAPESVLYAARDVYFLLLLHAKMLDALKHLGRAAWVEEECRRLELLKFVPPLLPSESFWNIKGCRRLTKIQTARLQALCIQREKLARQLNRPPFKILSERVLLELVNNPQADLTGIHEMKAMERAGQLDEFIRILKANFSETAMLPHKPRSDPPSRLNTRAQKCLAILKKWRQGKGELLALDPALLWPMRSLEILAQFPEKRQGEFKRQGESEVRDWQVREFAGELEQLCETFDA